MTARRSDDWREDAECAPGRGHHPDLWFDNPRQAKRVCLSCPVRTECLSWALTMSNLDGVAGGLTERERRVIRGRRRRASTDNTEGEVA